ncbi:hypothetical protein B0T22DRAFT_439521 [Podospora appendiculata]|uniref:Uncharacterized protein n=1 Tax=Podospora appendiculata TaxID=314037 RepID=A0AAE0X8C5_9PEZI|nr:hypothetical protein B0T22DRAFT_439521 [Podospora appendiculata]
MNPFYTSPFPPRPPLYSRVPSPQSPKPRPYRRPIGDNPELVEKQRQAALDEYEQTLDKEAKSLLFGKKSWRRAASKRPLPIWLASSDPIAKAPRMSLDAGIAGGGMDGDGFADFRFPNDGASTVTGSNDKQVEVPRGSDAAAAPRTDVSSKKTATSKRARAKRLPGKFKLRLKGFGQRLKRRLTSGKKKIKPKPPVLHVQLDQVMQQAGDTGKIVGMPPPRPEA